MDAFPRTLITAIVASVAGVVLLLGLILFLALRWQNLARRAGWRGGDEESQFQSQREWPQMRESEKSGSSLDARYSYSSRSSTPPSSRSSPEPSPIQSPRASHNSADALLRGART
ncbi:hypothetical protein GGR56DRAFT_669435 [Xylariaceae sp. FL0804]|nr:hypothetical protein GGR56DRAFT_669435 [Xylariaceae sp. FL0804]